MHEAHDITNYDAPNLKLLKLLGRDFCCPTNLFCPPTIFPPPPSPSQKSCHSSPLTMRV
ncbi:hypothetical protein BDR06DRAFT_947736 [Suillus hirtellus]|nr:hypothetical protein BDR06DRAFT_947736 [Suillus hirtellus]